MPDTYLKPAPAEAAPAPTYTLEESWPHRAVASTALLGGAAVLASNAAKAAGPGLSNNQAARFLAQAAMGISSAEVLRVKALGYSGWLEEQFNMAPSMPRWDWLMANGYNAEANKNGEAGADASNWVKLLSAPDTLRQRVTLALSEILVTSISGLVGSGWKAFSAAVHMDNLEKHAFGNYRALLQDVSLSVPMGEYLTYRNNVKFNPKTGAMPDENYAREVMQLFTIGLVQLNQDGTPKLVGGAQQETYTLDDIGGLARVFTGWNYDLTGTTTELPEFKRRPMTLTATRHESGVKTFLGSTIAAGTDGATSMTQALDILFAHPNVAPFISRQLIQRLVCSNPIPAYVARVAAVFNNDGKGVKGNLRAVIRAVLLDPEARDYARVSDPRFGKLREPILRLAAWARAFNVTSPGNLWAIGNTSDPSTRLGQSPMRSGSVFNFFRPGYVPPNSAIATNGMVAPEFQIANESTVVGYVNYMQTLISRGTGDVKANYSTLITMAETPALLLEEISVLMTAGLMSPFTKTLIIDAIGSMPKGSDNARLNRIYAALVMTMASPDFIVQK